MLSENEAFVEAIRSNPKDDAPKLMYADWLRETETDPRLGQWIHAFTELKNDSSSNLPAAFGDDIDAVVSALSLVVPPNKRKKKVYSLNEFESRMTSFWKEMFLSAGISCGPVDKKTVTKAVNKTYKCGRRKEPRVVLFFDSPLAGCVVSQILPEALRGVGEAAGGQLRDQLRDQLWDQLRDQLGGQLWDQLRGQLRDQLGDQLGGQLYRCGYGQHDGYWVSFYSFAHSVMGLPGLGDVDGLVAMTRLGWWWPYESICIVTGRPTKVSFDDDKWLHAPDGEPAILYLDGYAVYAQHGVRYQKDAGK